MNRRRDFHRLPGDVDVGQAQELLVHRRQLLLDLVGAEMPDVQERPAMFGAATGLDFFVDRACHHVTGRQFFLLGVVLQHETLAFAVRQVTTLATHGLGDQDPADARRPDHAGWMELHHLRVQDFRAGVEAHPDAVAGALPGIRRDPVNPAPSPGRHDEGFAGEGDELAVDPVVAESAHHPVAVLEQPGQRDFHVDVDAELDDAVLQTTNHFEACPIADVAKPPVRMGTKGALQHAAVGRPVEDCAVGLELIDAVR